MGSYRCLASLPGLRRILRVASLIACLGVAFGAAEINAQSPAPHPEAPDSAVQTIDVASPNSVLDLDGPWRFHAGHDQHFADPALDDSAWPSVRLSQPFQAVGIQSGELFGFSRTRDVSGLSAEKIASAAQGFGQNDDITVLSLSYVRLTSTSLREGHRLAKIL